jgi:hypothetical protein
MLVVTRISICCNALRASRVSHRCDFGVATPFSGAIGPGNGGTHRGETRGAGHLFERNISEWGCGFRDPSARTFFDRPPRLDKGYITEPLLEGVQPEHHQ